MDARASLIVLNAAQRLVDSGRHAALVDYLGSLPTADLEQSPTLALLYGMAQAQLGRQDINALGAIALETGRIDEAAEYFTHTLAEAERLGDRPAVGRCSNNLGIIANMRGAYGRAVGWYTLVIERADRYARPLLAAQGERDLARLLQKLGRCDEPATSPGGPAPASSSLGRRWRFGSWISSTV